MKRSGSQHLSSATGLSSLSANSTVLTISSFGKSILASPSSTLRILRQQSFIQMILLRSRAEVEQILFQPPGSLKELLLDSINLDDKLFWRLLKLSPEKLLLKNCIFDPNGLFARILKFFEYTHPLKPCLAFLIQFEGYTTKCTLSDGFHSPKFMGNEQIDSLLFISSNNIHHQPLSYDISSLAILPSSWTSTILQSPQSKQILKSTMSRQHPKLKHLLLMHMDIDDNIEDYISISHSNLDLIYMWNCVYRMKDLIWSTMFDSMGLVELMQTEKAKGFQFLIPINGHTTQILFNEGSSFLMPNSPDLAHGLVATLSDTSANDLQLDKISFLVLLSSGVSPTDPLSPQSKQNLKSIMDRQYPNLKLLLLIGINFDGDIEDYFPISQMNLDLIYLWNCGFITSDLICSTLCDSMTLINSGHEGDDWAFQVTIENNGHTISIICQDHPYLIMPNSPKLLHGLILHLGQALPNDLLMDNIDFLVLLPSESDPNRSSSSQSKPNLDSLMNRQWPRMKYLFSKGISIDNVEGMSSFIRRFRNLKVSTL